MSYEENVAFYRKNLVIQDQETGRIIPFELNETQAQLERHLVYCQENNLPCRMLVLKARQEGVSTWAEAALFRMARTRTDIKILILAHKEDASRHLFSITKRYHDNLPHKPSTTRLAARALRYEDTHSEFVVETAGAGGGGGRSLSCRGLHLSEVDSWPTPEELYTAILQTIPHAPDTILVVESTANGPVGFMATLWSMAAADRSGFEPFFFAWHDHKSYRRPLSIDDLYRFAPSEWVARTTHALMALEKKYGLGERERRRLGTGRQSASSAPGGIGVQESHGGNGRSETTPAAGAAGISSPTDGSNAKARSDSRGHFHVVQGRWERKSDPNRPLGAAASGQLPESAGAERRQPHTLGSDTDRLMGEVRAFFTESLTPYERGLIQEFELTHEQINWLRWCTPTNCAGDDIRRRREYPSRPDEAFQSSAGQILDPIALGTWTNEARRTAPVATGAFAIKDSGYSAPTLEFDTELEPWITLYEHPDPSARYVIAVDPSAGIKDSDWQVGFVMNVETGDQAAEFRATIDPDLAAPQIEALALHYNNALVGVEVNAGYGYPFMRFMLDRGYVNVYHRQAIDRITREWVKKPGWETTTKSRGELVTASKQAVREQKCKIKSLATLLECFSLEEDERGIIRARENAHDDGWIAYSICCVIRSEVLGLDSPATDDKRRGGFVYNLNQRAAYLRRKHEENSLAHIASGIKMNRTAVLSARMPRDNRRLFY